MVCHHVGMSESSPSEKAPALPLEPDRAARQDLTRRRLLTGLVGLGGVAAAGGVGYVLAPPRLKARLGLGPEPFVPDAPEGQVRLETVTSQARGRDVQLFTAVPHGYGDGAGLPVAVVLHGASATAADFQPFGLARFLTAAIEGGAEPFVLAGADGGVLRWEPDPESDDDPQAMVVDEMPGWLSDRGFDAERRALWGWSMGGYGSLRVAELHPDWARVVAAFSPAIGSDDAVIKDVAALVGLPLAVWCGTEDSFIDPVRQFVAALPEPPEIASYGEGGHSRVYWNDQTLDAFGFLAKHLAA